MAGYKQLPTPILLPLLLLRSFWKPRGARCLCLASFFLLSSVRLAHLSRLILLDFEQPIAALERKLHELQQLAADSEVEGAEATTALEAKIQTLKQETYANLTSWQRVQLSRHPERPYTLDYVAGMADKFIELHGDRTVRDDKALVGGFAEIGGGR
jgi:hypothetical protein